MITLSDVEVFFRDPKVLITFHEEDAPAVLAQMTEPRLGALPSDAHRLSELMLVVEGEGPAGPLTVAIGPMSASSVLRIHEVSNDLTLCALAKYGVSYGIVLDLTRSR